MQVKETALPLYVAYILNSELLKKQMKFNLVANNAVDYLDKSLIKNLLFPLPTIDIQENIVNLYQIAYNQKLQKESQAKVLLESIDTYILNELGITLPQKDNSLRSRIFTTNFSEISGNRFDSEYFSKNIKDILKAINFSNYPLDNIKNHCSFIAGYAFSSEDYLDNSDCILITIKNISENSIDFSNTTFLPSDFYDKYKRFIINKNDLIIAMTGATIGKVGIYDSNKKALLNQRNGIIKSVKLNTYYLMNLLNTEIYQNIILRNSVGGAQPNISENAIAKIKIPIPPIEKQTEIANHIKEIRQQANNLKAEATAVLENAKQEVEKLIIGE